MGMNDFSARVLSLQRDGYDFMDGKAGYKRETRMIRPRVEGGKYDVCVVTLWDDDSVTHACHGLPARAIHAGFVQR